MSRRPVIPRDCGLWSHGNRCCIGTTRTKRRCIGTKCTKLVASSPRSFRWSPEYMGSPHGLTTTSQKCSWSPKCKNSAYGPKCTKTMGSGGFLRECTDGTRVPRSGLPRVFVCYLKICFDSLSRFFLTTTSTSFVLCRSAHADCIALAISE